MAVARDLGGKTQLSTLEIRATRTLGRHTLVLEGELDITSAAELQPVVVRVCAEGARNVALDISRLDFIDSTGLQAILSAHNVCRDHGVGFTLTPPQGAVRRVFEITGLKDALPFVA
jgi:anti-sigma B factor antagonist